MASRPKQSPGRLKPIPVPENNSAKYFSYREAWGRIKMASANRYYLEAVSIEESIIADRLISFLVRAKKIEPDAPSHKYSLSNLIAMWRGSVTEAIPTIQFPDLREAIHQWRTRRNEVVHGMVKSMPGSPHKDVLNFFEEAERIALEGENLARALCHWCDRQKKLAQRQTQHQTEPKSA